jgi:hypothetical protein
VTTRPAAATPVGVDEDFGEVPGLVDALLLQPGYRQSWMWLRAASGSERWRGAGPHAATP